MIHSADLSGCFIGFIPAHFPILHRPATKPSARFALCCFCVRGCAIASSPPSTSSCSLQSLASSLGQMIAARNAVLERFAPKPVVTTQADADLARCRHGFANVIMIPAFRSGATIYGGCFCASTARGSGVFVFLACPELARSSTLPQIRIISAETDCRDRRASCSPSSRR